MFADAITALRKTSMRRAAKQAARTERLEADDETSEPSLAVERAVGSLNIKLELLSDDPLYRSRVAAAIQALPDKQRRVIEMILQEIPIDSSDREILTIRKALGVKSEKTVRNRRDAAYQSIRAALGIGTDDD
jgi:DNA-directed RNA polymerase specialized sigma24 family protein